MRKEGFQAVSPDAGTGSAGTGSAATGSAGTGSAVPTGWYLLNGVLTNTDIGSISTCDSSDICCNINIDNNIVQDIINIQGSSSASIFESMGSTSIINNLISNIKVNTANKYPDNPNSIVYAENAARSAIAAGYSNAAVSVAAAAAASAGVLSEQIVTRDRIRGSASTAIPSTAAMNAGSSAANAYVSTAASGSPSIQSKCADLQIVINSYMNDINDAKNAQQLSTQTSLTNMLCTFRAAFSSLYCNTFGSTSSGSGSSPKELAYPTTAVRGTLIYEPTNHLQMLTITTDTDVGDYIQNGDALYLGFGSEKQGPFYVVEQYANIDLTVTKFNDTNLAMRNSVEFSDIVKSLLTQTSTIPELTDATFVSHVIKKARANYILNLAIAQKALVPPGTGAIPVTRDISFTLSRILGYTNLNQNISVDTILTDAITNFNRANTNLNTYISTTTANIQSTLDSSSRYTVNMLSSINPNNITILQNRYINAGSTRSLANTNMNTLGSFIAAGSSQLSSIQNRYNTLEGSLSRIGSQKDNIRKNALSLEGSITDSTLVGSGSAAVDVLQNIFTLSLAEVSSGSGSITYNNINNIFKPYSGSGSLGVLSSSNLLQQYINTMIAYNNLLIQYNNINTQYISTGSSLFSIQQLQDTYNTQYRNALTAFNTANTEYESALNSYNTVMTSAGNGITSSTLQTAYNNLQNVSGSKAEAALNTAKSPARELASMGVTPTTTRINIPAPARRTTTFRISIGTNAVTSVAGIPKPSITKSIINQPLSVAKLMGISTTTVKQTALGENIPPGDISGTYFINGRLFNIDSNGGLPNNLNIGDLVYLVGDDHRSSELISKEFLLDKTKSELNQLTEYNNTYKVLPNMYTTINGSTGVTTTYEQQTSVEDNRFYLNSTWGGPNIWSGGSSNFEDSAMAAALESQIGPTVAAGIENIKNTRPSVTLGPFAIGASPTVNMIVFRGIRNQELDLFVNSPGLKADGELIQGPIYESIRLDNVKLYRPIHSEPKFLCKNIKGMGGGSIQGVGSIGALTTGSIMSSGSCPFNATCYAARYPQVATSYGSDTDAMQMFYNTYGRGYGHNPCCETSGGATVDMSKMTYYEYTPNGALAQPVATMLELPSTTAPTGAYTGIKAQLLPLITDWGYPLQPRGWYLVNGTLSYGRHVGASPGFWSVARLVPTASMIYYDGTPAGLYSPPDPATILPISSWQFSNIYGIKARMEAMIQDRGDPTRQQSWYLINNMPVYGRWVGPTESSWWSVAYLVDPAFPAMSLKPITFVLEQGTCTCPEGFYCMANKSYLTGDTGAAQCPLGVTCPAGTFCPEGYYCPIGGTQAVQCPTGLQCPAGSACPVGYYCPLAISGSNLPVACPPGTYCSSISTTAPINCPAGTYCPGNANTKPTDCPKNAYCPEGTAVPGGYYYVNSLLSKCPGGFSCPVKSVYTSGGSGSQPQSPIPCPKGTFCPIGVSRPIPCPENTRCYAQTTCPESYYCPEDYPTALSCPAGSYCPLGTSVPILCPEGSFCLNQVNAPTPCPRLGTGGSDGTGSQGTGGSSVKCPPGTQCPPGFYCPIGAMNTYTEDGSSGSSTSTYIGVAIDCPVNKYCSGDVNTTLDCPTEASCPLNTACPEGYYCPVVLDDYGKRQPTINKCTTAAESGGSAQPMSCPPGTNCPEGFYCPPSSAIALSCNIVNDRGSGVAPGTTNINEVCPPNTTCPIGYYCPPGTQTPILCPPGSYCPPGAKDVLPCPVGYYCPTPGATAPPGSSRICPIGTYCPEGGSAPTICPPGAYCPTPQAGSTVPCPPGKYCPTPGGSMAGSMCPPGTYCPGGGSTTVPCPPGKVCPTSGISTPLQCPIGQFCPVPSLITGSVCPPGTFCPGGAITAPPCPPGTFCPTSGGSTSVPCPPGTYCPNSGSSTTVPCPPGTYCPTSGQSTPGSLCPPGKYCPGGGSVPLACPPGKSCPTPGGSAGGSLCPPGTYCPGNIVIPLDCPPGTFCPTAGSSTTNQCPIGQYCPISGLTAGSLCPPGKYCPTPGGTTSGSTCPAGFSCAAGTVTPVACPSGTFSPAGASTCSACPAGQYSADGAQCTQCNAGYSCSGTGDTTAHAICPAGKYSNAGASSCESCPAGTYSSAIGAVSNITCGKCPKGTYSQATAATTCTPCPANTYNDLEGRSTTCIPCAPDTLTFTVNRGMQVVEHNVTGASSCNPYFTRYVGGEAGLPTLNTGESIICYLLYQDVVSWLGFNGQKQYAREFWFICYLNNVSTQSINSIISRRPYRTYWTDSLYTADDVSIPRKNVPYWDAGGFYVPSPLPTPSNYPPDGSFLVNVNHETTYTGAQTRRLKLAAGWTTFTLPPLSDTDYLF